MCSRKVRDLATDAVCQGMISCIKLQAEICDRAATMVMYYISDGATRRNGLTQGKVVQLTQRELMTDRMCQGMPACARIKMRVEACGRAASTMMEAISEGVMCRNGMTQERAVQLYTGSHWRVEAATLADVEHFTKFAVSPALPWQLRPLVRGRSVRGIIPEAFGRSSAGWQNRWQDTFLFLVSAGKAGNRLLLTSCNLVGGCRAWVKSV